MGNFKDFVDPLGFLNKTARASTAQLQFGHLTFNCKEVWSKAIDIILAQEAERATQQQIGIVRFLSKPPTKTQLSNFLGTPGEDYFKGKPEKFKLLFRGHLVG